jgi:hypothetical protein
MIVLKILFITFIFIIIGKLILRLIFRYRVIVVKNNDLKIDFVFNYYKDAKEFLYNYKLGKDDKYIYLK